MGVFLAELLTDSYEVVRFIGYHSLKELPGFTGFDYDFVGSETARREGRLRALSTWHELADRPTPARSVLIDARGRLIGERFQELRNQRVDPPVFLAE